MPGLGGRGWETKNNSIRKQLRVIANERQLKHDDSLEHEQNIRDKMQDSLINLINDKGMISIY